VHFYWIFETQGMVKWIVGNQINNSTFNHKTFDINVNPPFNWSALFLNFFL
jgi:hypothetical protein